MSSVVRRGLTDPAGCSTITYDLNGTTIICNREIPGITGGALDSAEAEPGPLLLQGDHGPIEYRNIVITPATAAR